MIKIKEIKSKSEFKQFVKFPFTLYKNNPYWIPPLVNDELESLDTTKNPVFEVAKAQYFLAYKNNEIVGRIAAIRNSNEIENQGKLKMRFGWFDVIDDVEVTKALLEKVEEIGKKHHLEYIEGPLGFGNLDKAGALTEGYDELSTMVTNYNHAYYIDHFVELGMIKASNWIEYVMTVPQGVSERVAQFSKKVGERYKLRLKEFSTKSELKALAPQMFKLLDASYSSLESYVPLTERQKVYYTEKYFNFIDPNYVTCVVDQNDSLVAFAITMPSYSKALQKANGSLFPLGWYHLLKARKNNPNAAFYLIGILPEFQRKGVTAILFEELILNFNRLGIIYSETNPELENNVQVQSLWKNYDMRQHKRRSSFRKDI